MLRNEARKLILEGYDMLEAEIEMSKTSPKTKGQREKEGRDHPAKRKSA